MDLEGGDSILVIGRHKDHGGLVAAQGGQQLEAAHWRHLYIEEEQVDSPERPD